MKHIKKSMYKFILQNHVSQVLAPLEIHYSVFKFDFDLKLDFLYFKITFVAK